MINKLIEIYEKSNCDILKLDDSIDNSDIYDLLEAILDEINNNDSGITEDECNFVNYFTLNCVPEPRNVSEQLKYLSFKSKINFIDGVITPSLEDGVAYDISNYKYIYTDRDVCIVKNGEITQEAMIIYRNVFIINVTDNILTINAKEGTDISNFALLSKSIYTPVLPE